MAKKKDTRDQKEKNEERKKRADEQKKQTNKILDNDFDNVDWYDDHIKFEVDPSHGAGDDVEDDVNQKLFYDKVVANIEGTKFERLNDLDSNGEYYELSKEDINEVYEHVLWHIEGMRIEILYVLTEYFDVKHSKFYDALASHHKEDLLGELKQRGYISDESLGGSLF